MVYKEIVADLMELTWNLAYLHETTGSVIDFNQKVPVRGRDYILDTLTDCVPYFETLSSVYEMKDLENAAKKWSDYFNQKYHGRYYYLDRRDAKKFHDEIFDWYTQILNEYSKSSTELLDNIKLLTECTELAKHLDSKTADDLLDGVGCIGNGIPTPAVMILYKVGESMVKKLYEKQMKKPVPEKHTLGMMIKDLKNNTDVQNDNLINLLDFRKPSRDKAQHPGERYSMKDAEATFMKIRELIEEIQKKL
jgi:hypothetical protein